jgi:hypothetical protein
MWLSDLLPQCHINAVIASFSYESKWMMGRSQMSLRDYAELLLNVLLHHRSKVSASSHESVRIVYSIPY